MWTDSRAARAALHSYPGGCGGFKAMQVSGWKKALAYNTWVVHRDGNSLQDRTNRKVKG